MHKIIIVVLAIAAAKYHSTETGRTSIRVRGYYYSYYPIKFFVYDQDPISPGWQKQVISGINGTNYLCFEGESNNLCSIEISEYATPTMDITGYYYFTAYDIYSYDDGIFSTDFE